MKIVFAMLLVGVAGCVSGLRATRPAVPPSDLVVFCVTGDTPYQPGEDALLARQLSELPKECRFLLHVGDIQPGPHAPVTEAPYQRVAHLLRESKTPVFIVPGDNEWNDAPNVDEAWQFWTRNFLRLDQHWAHGLDVTQQTNHLENLAFMSGGVLFVGINLVGGRVHDAAEWARRHADDVAWIEQQFADHGADAVAAVIFAQARPIAVHADFVCGFERAAQAFANPVLFIHGDGHVWQRDRPFANAPNIERVQVDMGGIAPPVCVRVTTDAAHPFVFDRRQPAGAPYGITVERRRVARSGAGGPGRRRAG